MVPYERPPSPPPSPCRRRATLALGAGLGAALLRAPLRALAAMRTRTCLYQGEALARYGFPQGHPLGVDRQGAFLREAARQRLDAKAVSMAPKTATREEIERFHTKAHVERVLHAQRNGLEFLDNGDTPVFPGVFEASATVVGSALDGLHHIMRGECLRTFQPIGGLHHARREASAGFCVFNDLGVVIETLRAEHGVRRIAYVDIDVHHGDGVFYPYEDDPDLVFADIHEDYRSLYPGTGRPDETGTGAARGTKLNINLPSGAGDREFLAVWPDVVGHLRRHAPQFVLFQCGADGLDGDPLARLRYSPQAHMHATRSLVHLADEFCAGRIMAFGGGGYDRDNLARAWCGVLRELIG
jgi:acetoin utilization protein AcuC